MASISQMEHVLGHIAVLIGLHNLKEFQIFFREYKDNTKTLI